MQAEPANRKRASWHAAVRADAPGPIRIDPRTVGWLTSSTNERDSSFALDALAQLLSVGICAQPQWRDTAACNTIATSDVLPQAASSTHAAARGR